MPNTGPVSDSDRRRYKEYLKAELEAAAMYQILADADKNNIRWIEIPNATYCMLYTRVRP